MEILNKIIKDKEQGFAFYYQHNKNVVTKTNGKVSDIKSADIDFNTNFRLASVSKQFIAYGIIQLVEDKKLDYDTTINKIFAYLPEYFNKITIKHLLTHTSGIYDYENIPHKDDDKQIKDQDILTFLKTTNNTYFEPGTKYQYSNTGFILLGLIIEEISKIKIDKYLDKIFNEAGMKNTMVNYQGVTNIPDRAYGHIIENGNLIVKDQYWCSATIGDGGIYSNINDLNKWIDYLSANEVKLKQSMFKANILKDGTKTEYGYGIRVVEVNNKLLYYHCGDTIGTNTMILFSNDLNVRCILLTNLGDVDMSSFKDEIIEKIKNKL